MSLLSRMKKKNLIKYGTFTLRSGKTSSYYCDIKEALGDPELLHTMTTELARIVPPNATCIAGSGYGGIALATLVAHKTKLPLSLVRDKAKAHGTGKLIDGYIPHKHDKVCIVDDVFTTGSSITDTKEKLKGTKTKYTKPVVVLNRSNKKNILSLFTDKDLGRV